MEALYRVGRDAMHPLRALWVVCYLILDSGCIADAVDPSVPDEFVGFSQPINTFEVQMLVCVPVQLPCDYAAATLGTS
jgi:hypothetical protein